MKLSMRLIAAAMCLLMIVSVAGCGNTPDDVVDTLRYNDVSYDSETIADGVVVENDTWQLVWDDTQKSVMFVEKATGNVWSNAPEEFYDPAYEGTKNTLVPSAVHVYYHYPKNMSEEIITFSKGMISSYDGDIYLKKIDNGLRVVYDFMSNSIAVPVEYTLDGDHFSIKVDPTQIADDGENIVTGVAVAPFICGVQNDAKDSFIFIPDGTGAIIEPNTLSTIGDVNAADNLIRFYGNDLTVQSYYNSSVIQQLSMPVIGVKKGDKGLVGIIDEGAQASSLAWRIGSTNIGFSTAYTMFRFRGYSLVTPPRGYPTAAAYIKIFEDRISTNVQKTDYYALNGEDASLAGMADVYRNYLIEKAGLKKSDTAQKTVAIKYVGGVIQPDFFLGLPTTKLFPLTTTEQAQTMTEAFTEKLGTDFYVDMVGYGTSGLDLGKLAGGFTVGKEMGGSKGMTAFSDKMTSLGINWYMDFDLIGFKKGAGGYNSSNNGVRWLDGQTAYFTGFDSVQLSRDDSDRYNILARKDLIDATDTLLNKTASMKLGGISLGSVSNTIYSDFDSVDTLMCGGIQEDVTTLLGNVDKAGYAHLATGGNDYAVVASDAVIDAPLYSSNYDVCDKDVPFYQMVFHGYRPMNSVSVNLCADSEDALLRCVSAGIAPSYTITYNYDNELVTNEQTLVFGSSYEGNKDKIANTYAAIKDYVKSIDGATVVGYDIISADVRVTRFSNGVYAVVNFGDTDVNTAYGNVKAGGWITGVQA